MPDQYVINSYPEGPGIFLGSIIGRVVGDVTITHDEIEGLMAGLLYTGSPLFFGYFFIQAVLSGD